MSKKLKNYPDPMLVVDRFGSDALRLYLVTSPCVRGEDMKFREDGVKDIVKDVLLPWFNAYRFLVQTLIWRNEVSCLFVCLFVYLVVCLFVSLFVCLLVCLFVCLRIYLFICCLYS